MTARRSLAIGTAMIEHCPRCVVAVPTAPLRSWPLEQRTVAVYECPKCLHAWFTSYNTTGPDAWGAEPVRIGDAL